MNKVSRMISAVLLCVAMMLSFAVFASGDSDDNAGNGKKVYFAGPMFNHAEKDFNLKITNVLEEFGYEVFLPQRDGIEAALLEGKSEEEIEEIEYEHAKLESESIDDIFAEVEDIEDVEIISLDTKEREE